MAISGASVRLRLIERDDLPLKVKWINDPEVHEHLHYEVPFGLGQTEAWFQRATADRSRRDLVIETLDGHPIGLVGLIGIDLTHRVAEIYIAIGEKEYWGKGVMLEAESLLIQWAFDTFDLHKIIAQTRSTNLASMITMKKLGFEVEGTLREERYISGLRVDVVRLGLLRPDFKQVSERMQRIITVLMAVDEATTMKAGSAGST